jgi:hypothetical protein
VRGAPPSGGGIDRGKSSDKRRLSMGVAGAAPYGLYIKSIQMTYDPNSGRLTRISEAAVLDTNFNAIGGHGDIRSKGLKLGFRFRRSHGSTEVAVTTAKATGPGETGPPSSQYVTLAEDPQVTQELEALFGVDRCHLLFFSWPNERWVGFKATNFPQAASPVALDRLFFRVVLGNFRTIHQRECDVLPVVATLGDDVFQMHYALGVSVYSRGGAGAPTFDTQVLGRG